MLPKAFNHLKRDVIRIDQAGVEPDGFNNCFTA